MGSTFDYVPVQLTKAFREAQSDENFQGWLKMQDAVMDIEFPIYDLPDIRGQMFTKDSLAIVEAKLMDLYANDRAAYASREDLSLTMRFVYYIGETFRRALDGTWVALPPRDEEPPPHALMPAIDVPFSEVFVQPLDLVGMALNRRSGIEITRALEHLDRAHAKWIAAGKPERTYRGTLREVD